jgi:hypothetical protein
MNDWDVSGIANFEELFRDLEDFNEPIANWDVSRGENFVSN